MKIFYYYKYLIPHIYRHEQNYQYFLKLKFFNLIIRKMNLFLIFLYHVNRFNKHFIFKIFRRRHHPFKFYYYYYYYYSYLKDKRNRFIVLYVRNKKEILRLS
jgi:hypothetical protein